MKTIHKLQRPKLPETPKLKVAAYDYDIIYYVKNRLGAKFCEQMEYD